MDIVEIKMVLRVPAGLLNGKESDEQNMFDLREAVEEVVLEMCVANNIDLGDVDTEVSAELVTR